MGVIFPRKIVPKHPECCRSGHSLRLMFTERKTRDEMQSNRHCVFSALEQAGTALVWLKCHDKGEFSFMKTLALGTATVTVLALLSTAGCAQTGKGKAPPPVVTKG